MNRAEEPTPEQRVPAGGAAQLPYCCKILRGYARARESWGLESRMFGLSQFLWIILLSALFVRLLSIALNRRSNEMELIEVTGVVTIVIGLFYSIIADADQFRIVNNLHENGIAWLGRERLIEIRSTLLRISIASQILCAMAIIVVVGELVSTERTAGYPLISLWILPVLIGMRIGRLLANGTTVWVAFGRGAMSFNMTVNHFDGAGGVSHIASFYLRQASVALIPAMWALAWILIIHFDHYQCWGAYADYQKRLPGLWVGLGMSLLWAIANFVLPMRPVCNNIRAWKSSIRPHVESWRHQLELYSKPNVENRARDLTLNLYGYFSISNWGISSKTRGAILAALSTLAISALFSLVAALFVSGTPLGIGACE